MAPLKTALLSLVLLIPAILIPAAAAAQGALDAGAADPRIAAALQQVSAERIRSNIEKLVSFGTRSTLSAEDPASIAAGHGIGAAREWIKSQFENYSKDCAGCLEVKTDSFTEAPAERIPKPTEITNVYAVLKGTDPEAAKRIVLVTGHYCWSRATTTRATATTSTSSMLRPAPMTTAAARQ
jgi:hypothetical protein